MRSAVTLQTPILTRTKSHTAVHLAITAIGGASFAAAMFFAALGQPAILAIGLDAQGMGSTIVEGADNVTALELELTARREAVSITDLSLNVVGDLDGDLSTIQNDLVVGDYILNCSLYHADQLISGPRPVVNNQLTFNGMSTTIPRNAIVAAQVKCDFANPAATHPDPYALAWSIAQDTDVTAEDSQGDALTVQQIIVGAQDAGVNTQATQQVALYEHGNVDIAISPAAPNGDILLPQTDREIGRWNVTADLEDMSLEKLTFKLVDLNSARSVESVTLALTTDITVSQTVPLVNGVAVFNNFAGAVSTTDNAALILSMRTTQSSFVPGGLGVSGDEIQFALETSELDSFRAVGMASGSTLSEADVTHIVASQTKNFAYRYTEPTITLSPLSPSGVAIPGNIEVLRFNISANSADDVTISQLTFRSSLQDNAGTDWNHCGTSLQLSGTELDLFDLTNGGLAAPVDVYSDWQLSKTTGEACDGISSEVGYVTVNLSTPLWIPAGRTHTYALYFDASGASGVNDDSVRFDFTSPEPITNAITWDDGSGQSIDGDMVNNLPLSGGTLIF